MTAKMKWNNMYTIKILMTFFKELTTQSKTAFSLGTRLIVFNGRNTLNTLRDLMVPRLAVADFPFVPVEFPVIPLQKQKCFVYFEAN